MSAKASSLRDAFAHDEGVTYLNAAYLGCLPKASQEAAARATQRQHRPWRDIVYPASFFEDVERCRALFARLVNAPDAGHVALVPAASYGVAVAAKCLARRFAVLPPPARNPSEGGAGPPPPDVKRRIVVVGGA